MRLEIEAAMAKGIPIIQLLVDNAQMPQADALPETLAPLVFRNALQIPHEPYFHAGVDLLIEQIGDVGASPQAPAPTVLRRLRPTATDQAAILY